MVVVKSAILDEMSGKLGGGWFLYTRMGKTIMRRSPGKRKKSSAKQETCMNNTTCMNSLYSYVKRFLECPVWKLAGAEFGKMANNYFARVNKGLFDERMQIRSYDSLVLTEGTLQNPAGMSVSHAGGYKYNVTWEAEDAPGSRSGTNELKVIIAADYSDETIFDLSLSWAKHVSGKRSRGNGCFTIPEEVVNFAKREGKDTLHAYCLFASEDEKAFSRSKHFSIPVE